MSSPVVHLELHTDDIPGACRFYTQLFGWRPEQIATDSGRYVALELGDGLGGGMVECGIRRPLWLPYVQVSDIVDATAWASRLGATVLLAPREGPAGWRSVVTTPAGAEIALWQQKEWRT
jgi:hypothetical protein